MSRLTFGYNIFKLNHNETLPYHQRRTTVEPGSEWELRFANMQKPEMSMDTSDMVMDF